MSGIITSPKNSKVKLVRSLQGRRRNRQSEGVFIAEGVRLIEEAASVHWPMEFVLFDETLSERGTALITALQSDPDIQVLNITARLMAEISETDTPQGILAVVKQQVLALPQSPTFILIADQIRDPGNMGTILRTAEAAGADGVLLSPGTVDAFSPKVVRAGMGAHFHLPILRLPWEDIHTYLKGLPVFLAESEGGTPLWEADLRQPCALLIGGEAFGASTLGEEIATKRLTIPMQGRAESLNAAVAAGIMIAEVLRQRYQDSKE